MTRCDQAVITDNRRIAPDIYRMELRTAIAQETSCGQFVEIRVPGFYLRRPISVSEVKDCETIVLIYKTVGKGTEQMAKMTAGEELSLFGPLGHGFPLEDRDPVLVGGGVGIPPLYETAKQYLKKGHSVTAVLGFNDASQIFLKDEFEALGCTVRIATMDGSCGTKGTVIDACKAEGIDPSFCLACGPLPMLKACETYFEEGYVSLEARMACGMGACMGCVVKDHEGGSWRVCKDGPVFPLGKAVL